MCDRRSGSFLEVKLHLKVEGEDDIEVFSILPNSLGEGIGERWRSISTPLRILSAKILKRCRECFVEEAAFNEIVIGVMRTSFSFCSCFYNCWPSSLQRFLKLN